MLERILIVGPNWVGDMVMAQSLFILLAKNNPGCKIDVLAPAWTLPLLQHMAEVSQPIEIPLKRGELGFAARYKLGRKLREGQYQQVILLPNSLKSALIPFFANIPLRTGYIGEQRWGLLNDLRRLDKQKLPMTVQRFVALGLEKNTQVPPVCPEPRLNVKKLDLTSVADRFELDIRGKKILGLCPGAEYGEAKRWPVEHFAAVAQQRKKRGWEIWLFGSQRDQAVCAQINQTAGDCCIDFSGRTNMNDAINLLALTHCVLSNDSGLMHVAAALDKPLVAVYGSSDPGFTPPLNKHARILSLGLDCSPCFKRVCPFGHTRCLQDITPDQVLDLLPLG